VTCGRNVDWIDNLSAIGGAPTPTLVERSGWTGTALGRTTHRRYDGAQRVVIADRFRVGLERARLALQRKLHLRHGHLNHVGWTNEAPASELIAITPLGAPAFEALLAARRPYRVTPHPSDSSVVDGASA